MTRIAQWISTEENRIWSDNQYIEKNDEGSCSSRPNLFLNGQEYQRMNGFGGCFNELGWLALAKLGEEDREDVIRQLFDPVTGSKITHCRLPIGANDYAVDWYSHNETAGDYEMNHFSISRDYEYLIPFVKSALKYNPDLKIFASPWSPPIWMKFPKVYNGGKLIWTKENLTAYALYFVKFVQAYTAEGINIGQIHIQNEPVAYQKFPCCLWTGEELKVFIRDYLGPAFAQNSIESEIWLGTLNAPGGDYKRIIFDKLADEDYDFFANHVLQDDEARQYIKGVGYQWGGRFAVQRTFESWWPEIRLMQTENECGFGDNTWEFARYVFTCIKHYVSNGCEAYMYWNMVLEPKGTNTWSDDQNSMITVDPESKRAIYNPDFYVMKHFSAFVEDGSICLGLKGPWAGDTLAFKKMNGDYVFIMLNPFEEAKEVRFELENKLFVFDLPPLSFHSVVVAS